MWKCRNFCKKSSGKEANEGFEAPEKAVQGKGTEIEEIRGEEHSSEHGLKPTCFRDLAYSTNE